jgi:hypothetical protein
MPTKWISYKGNGNYEREINTTGRTEEIQIQLNKGMSWILILYRLAYVNNFLYNIHTFYINTSNKSV